MKVTNPFMYLYAMFSVTPVTFGLLAGLIIGIMREAMGEPLFGNDVSGLVLFFTYVTPLVAASAYLHSKKQEIHQAIKDQVK